MKKLLIVVDYQKDFVDGSLGFEQARVIEPNIYNKIMEYKNNNHDVLFTFDTHGENYLSTMEGKSLPVVHCVEGSEGWSLYGSVKSLCGDSSFSIQKPSFGSVELMEFLKKRGYDEVELVGVVTNICVVSNAVIAQTALPEAKITIDASCTASNVPALHEKALDVMEGLSMNIINRGGNQ